MELELDTATSATDDKKDETDRQVARHVQMMFIISKIIIKQLL